MEENCHEKRNNKVRVDRDEQNRLIYKYSRYDEANPNIKEQGEIILPAEQVLHIPGLGFDGLVGYSPIAMAKNAIGLAAACDEYGATFFANGASPSAVLEHPGVIKNPERVREAWRKAYGSGNAHKVKLHTIVGIGHCAGKAWGTNQESKSISSLTIPKSVKKIGDYAFYKTSNLTSVTIPGDSELEYIGRNAFSMENKTDGTSTYSKLIAPYAFYKSKITSITIPKGIEEIGLSAFRDCDSLQDITFSVNPLNADNKYTSDLKQIGDYAFHDTSSIQHIYLSVDGVRVTDHYYTTFPEGLEKIGKLILGGTNGNLVGNLVFPDTISNLGAQMFNQTDSFKNELLYVGDGITTIKYTGTGDNIISFNGNNAEGTFNKVPQAYTLMLGKSVINIEENALRNFIDVREIILPDSGNTQLTIASGSVRLPGLIIIQSELDGLTNLQSILNTRRTNNDTYKTKPTYVVFTNIDSNQKNDILTSVLGLDSNNKLNGTQIYPVFSDEINLSKIQTIHQHLINQNDDNHNYTEQDINYYFQDLSMFSNANKSLLNGYVNIDDFTTSTKKGLSPQALRILLNVISPQAQNAPSYPAPPRPTSNGNNLTYLAEALWLNEKRRTA